MKYCLVSAAVDNTEAFFAHPHDVCVLYHVERSCDTEQPTSPIYSVGGACTGEQPNEIPAFMVERFCQEVPGLNKQPIDFQSDALPTELNPHIVW